MAKPPRRKKRRHSSAPPNVDFLCNVGGLEGSSLGTADASVEACLTEMEGAQNPAAKVQKAPLTDDFATRVSSLSSAKNNAWKSAFSEWVTTGKHVAHLPNPQVEVSRHFHVQQLSTFLLQQSPSLRMPAFERWLIDSKWDEQSSAVNGDPVIPCQPSLETSASQRLVEELAVDHANEIVRELCLKTKRAAQEVSAMELRCLPPLSRGSRIQLEKSSQHNLLYKRKSWKKPFRVQVNASHYDKLWDAFIRTYPSLKQEKRVLPSFHVLVFCLLLRYSSLSGGQLLNDLRGGGMQGAVMPDTFDVLQRYFPSHRVMECFASPWNMHLPVYASAFPDLDAHFGSIGDFREIDFGGDCDVYEANPPFSPGLMLHMVKRMKHGLTTANEEERQLTFFVIVPTAADDDDSASPVKHHADESFSGMINSTFCRLHIILPSRQHGYVEGAQHLRPTRYKQSSYDTSLILLMSDAANDKFSNRKAFEKDMRNAFASRHEEEIKQRQQKK